MADPPPDSHTHDAALRAAGHAAYAIGQGGSTQTMLFMVVMAVSGAELAGLARGVLMVLAWGINLAVAESLIRRMSAPRASIAVASGGSGSSRSAAR